MSRAEEGLLLGVQLQDVREVAAFTIGGPKNLLASFVYLARPPELDVSTSVLARGIALKIPLRCVLQAAQSLKLPGLRKSML